MATYMLVAFNVATINALRTADYMIGGVISYTLSSHDIKGFPSLLDFLDEPIIPPPQAPQPIPIERDGHQIGTILGYYYDGEAVGFHSAPATLPPHSVAYVIPTVHLDELHLIDNAAFLADMDAFLYAPNQHTPHISRMTPVFYNDTETPYDLHIVKTRPYQKGDEIAFDGENHAFNPSIGGTVWNMKHDYVSQRLASLCP